MNDDFGDEEMRFGDGELGAEWNGEGLSDDDYAKIGKNIVGAINIEKANIVSPGATEAVVGPINPEVSMGSAEPETQTPLEPEAPLESEASAEPVFPVDNVEN